MPQAAPCKTGLILALFPAVKKRRQADALQDTMCGFAFGNSPSALEGFSVKGIFDEQSSGAR